MRCTTGALFVLAFGAFGGCAPALARAQESGQGAQVSPPAPVSDPHEAARGLAEEAIKLYEAGRLELALELFQKADALYPAPSFHVYIGRIYGRLGKLRKSLASYDLALQMPRPPSPSPTFIEGQTAAAAERPEIVKRVPVVRIEVTGVAPQDVAVTVDDEAVSPAARLHVELDPGSHVFAVRAAGMRARSETLVLQEGTSLEVRLKLEPVQPDAATPRPWKPLAITSGAIAGAGLIVAIATGVVLAQKHSTIESQCPHDICTPSGWATRNSVAPLNAVNLGSWIVVAAGGAATAVFAYLGARKGPTPTPATAIVPAPLTGGGGVWLTTRF